MVSGAKRLFNVRGPEFVCASILKVGPYSEMVNDPTISSQDECLKFKPGPERLRISVQAGKVENMTRDVSKISDVVQKTEFNLSIPQDSEINLFIGRLGDHMKVQNDIALVSGADVGESVIAVVDEYRGRLSTLLSERKHIPLGFETWPYKNKELWMEAHRAEEVYQEMFGLGSLGHRILRIKDFSLGIIQCGDGFSYRQDADGVLVKMTEDKTANLKMPDYALAVSNKYNSVSAASGSVCIGRSKKNGRYVSLDPFDPINPNAHVVTDSTTGKLVVRAGDDLLISFSPA